MTRPNLENYRAMDYIEGIKQYTHDLEKYCDEIEQTNETADLYSKLVCALLHDLKACEHCQKCGDDPVEVRMNLVREVAKMMGKKLPWVE